MLTGQDHLFPIIVEERQGHMLVDLGALNVFEQGAVQIGQKLQRVCVSGFLQRTRDRLNHQHQHTTFKAMPGHVTDADFQPVATLQNIVVIATDLFCSSHVGCHFQPLRRLQF